MIDSERTHLFFPTNAVKLRFAFVQPFDAFALYTMLFYREHTRGLSYLSYQREQARFDFVTP